MAKETTTKTSKSALALALLAGVSLAGIDSASAAMNPRTLAAPTVRAKAGGVPMARPNHVAHQTAQPDFAASSAQSRCAAGATRSVAYQTAQPDFAASCGQSRCADRATRSVAYQTAQPDFAASSALSRWADRATRSVAYQTSSTRFRSKVRASGRLGSASATQDPLSATPPSATVMVATVLTETDALRNGLPSNGPHNGGGE